MNDQHFTPNPQRPEANEPLKQTSKSLEAFANESTMKMDAKTKSRQRDMLLAEAKKHHVDQAVAKSIEPEIQAMPVVETKPVESRFRVETVDAKPARSPFAWFAGFATVGLVAVLAIMILPNLNQGSFQAAKTAITDRLTIPEALAADAFSITANKSDRAGLDKDTSFVINSKVDVTEKQLAQTLQIVPAIDFQLRKTSDKTFTLTPKEDLDTGKIYKIAVATDVKKDDGSLQPREFAFAFQTKNDFRVLTTIPADGSSSVPVDSAIEFQLSQSGVTSATSSFEIQPAVKGNLRINGQTVTFVPSEKLKPETRYQARLKNTLTIEGSDLALAEDSLVHFETETVASTTVNQAQQFQLGLADFVEVRPSQEPAVFINSQVTKTQASTTIDVTGYALTVTEAKEILSNRLSIPDWVSASRNAYGEYAKLSGRAAAFTAKTTLDGQGNGYGDQLYNVYLRLPKANTGLYAVRAQPAGGKASWFVLQVTDTMTYTVADKDTLLLWVVDANTRKQLTSLPVKSSSASVVTDADGLARIPSPSVLTATNTDMNANVPVEILEVGSGNNISLEIIRASNNMPYQWANPFQTTNSTWNYLYADRPLYRPTDSLNFFAFAQDRDTHAPVDNLRIELRRGDVGIAWLWNRDQKSYQGQNLTSDTMGSTSGTFSWSNYAPGYYTLVLLRNGQQIGSRSFEVRDFAKPTYQVDIQVDQKSLFLGDAITGKLKVNFYSGAPVSRTSFSLSQDGSSYGNGSTFVQGKELTTDENGEATFRLSTSSTVACDTTNLWNNCGNAFPLTLRAVPVRAEEANIQGTATITAYPSALDLIVQPHTEGKNVSVTIKTRRVSLDKEVKDFEVWPNKTVTVEYKSVWWEKIEAGNYYDAFTKKTVPTYRYDQRFGPVKTAELQTDSSGRVQFNTILEDDRAITIAVKSNDDARRPVLFQTMISKGGYDHVTYDDSEKTYTQSYYADQQSSQNPNLIFLPKNDMSQFSIGEKVQVQYRIGDQPIDTQKNSPVLFVRAQRGLKEAQLGSGADLAFTFTETNSPNVEIRAIALIDGQFQMQRLTAGLKVSDQLLDVAMTTPKAMIAPGEQGTVTIKTTAQATKSPVNARLACSTVDASLLTLAGTPQEDPVYTLYSYVPDGILYEIASHQKDAYSAFAGGGGGAEMGGGGGQNGGNTIRKNFKDTADFRILNTDSQGNVDFTFTAPDNLTAWRIECVGLTSDLKTGANRTTIQVNKPVFVDAVLPPRVLSTDKPILKLRAFGQGLPTDSDLTFRIEAPSLGISQTIAGKAGMPTYLAIDKLPVGDHVLTIRVTGNNTTDAVERHLTVVDSNYTHQEMTRLDATPGLSLPSDKAASTRLIITNNGRASLLNLLYNLRNGFSGRADSLLAMQRSEEILQQDLGQPNGSIEGNLMAFQGANGGIKLLPYSQEDLALSAEFAATDVSKIDANQLRAFFYGKLNDSTQSRESQIQAMSGLAALQEPVLASLQDVMKVKDLNFTEQLAILRGLIAAGDQENARAFLDKLLTTSEEHDGLIDVKLGKTADDHYVAAANLAAAAAELDHPKATALSRFVESNWSNDAFPLLAKLRYVIAMRNHLPLRDITLRYSVNGQSEQTINLKRDVPSQMLTLTRDEAASFRVTSIDGPATLVMVREVVGRPTSSVGLKLTRSYTAPRALTELLDGDTVHVTLKAEFGKDATEGCYAVTDYLPGNLEPIINWYWGWDDKPFYPVDSQSGRMSFVVCHGKNDPMNQSMEYDARIVSRGTFSAEAPLMQHLDQPSRATLGTDQSFKTK